MIQTLEPLQNFKDYRANLRRGEETVQAPQTLRPVRIGESFAFRRLAVLDLAFPIDTKSLSANKAQTTSGHIFRHTASIFLVGRQPARESSPCLAKNLSRYPHTLYSRIGSKLPLDMDSEVGLNRVRQNLADTFRRMTALRNGEVVLPNGGTGYHFNGEGNQVSYRCDAKRVTTINFDRNKIRGMATELGRKADDISAQLDKCLVNTTVGYQLLFEMSDSFDVILSDFIERRSGK